MPEKYTKLQSDETIKGGIVRENESISKLYMSNKVENIQFYEDSTTINATSSVTKNNIGLSFIIYCICKGVNDVDKLANMLIDQFNIKNTFLETKQKILLYTIYDESISDNFTYNIDNANLSPEVYGVFGMRYPKVLHIELTGTCNFKCSHCYKNAIFNGKYIDFERLERDIYNRLKGIVPVIHFTGGEPTLHKQFEKIIGLFNDDFTLQLITNGSRITSYPIDTFKKFQAIDISLYGLSEEEYGINTGDSKAYRLVQDGCKLLHSNGIKFRVTTVLNQKSQHQMEEYVKYAINFGAESISFSLPVQSGRLFDVSDMKWSLSKTEKQNIYRILRNLQDTYKDKIYIKEWYRTNYSDMWKYYPSDDSLRCGAGKVDWWMSEQFHFRPCSFLPYQYMNLDYETWYRYIINEEEINWTTAKESLERFAADNNCSITDICSIFRRM